jgi:hypothetical protein
MSNSSARRLKNATYRYFRDGKNGPHLILLDFITWTIFGERYRSLSYSLCNFLNSPVTMCNIYHIKISYIICNIYVIVLWHTTWNISEIYTRYMQSSPEYTNFYNIPKISLLFYRFDYIFLFNILMYAFIIIT